MRQREQRSRDVLQVEVRRIARTAPLIRNRTGLGCNYGRGNSARSACVAITALFLLIASNSKGLTASSLQDRQQHMVM